MEQFSTIFLSFIDTWGYVAVAVLMAVSYTHLDVYKRQV